MVNYKNTRKITVGGIEIESFGTARTLTEQTAASSTADAMQKESGTYQVPTGKSFTVKGIRYLVDATGGGTLAVYEGATEDATTTIKRTIDLAAPGTGVWCEQAVNFVIAAGKFVTIVPSSTQVIFVQLIGYEW